MKKKIILSARDKAEIKRFLIENITFDSREFSLIIDLFIECSANSEMWLAHSKELLNMELQSLKQRKMPLELAIPESRYRIYEREPETNTWKSLITGVGGYLIDPKKHSVVKINAFNYEKKS